MRWPRGLARRLVVTVVVVVMVCVVLSSLFVTRTVASQAASNMRRVFDPVPAAVLEACEDAPDAWSPQGPAWRAWAYDRETLTSLHPDAPPIDPVLAWHVRPSGEGVRFFPSGPWGGVVAWSAAEEGPCSMVALFWGMPEGRDAVLRTATLRNLVLVFSISLLAALFMLLRPLLGRLRALATAARSVGCEGFEPPEAGDDDFGDVARALVEADARVRADRREERARRVALERHLAEIAHDLRTPLASLQLRLESLPTDADVEAAIGDVVYLGLLTENLHLEARLRDMGDLPSDPVDLGALVSRVTERFRFLGGRRGVFVDGATPEQPVWVAAVPVHAEQAVANLVHNAIVHRGGSGQVAVVLEAGRGRFRLEVADDGPGVPEDRIRAILEGARDVAPAARRGLGLRIVVAVCARAGWSLDVRNAEEGGLVVTIEGSCVEAEPLHESSTGAP